MTRLAALLPLSLAACVSTGDEGMVVVNNAAVEGSCVLTSNPMGAQRGHGTIWTGTDDPYILTPLIQSRISQTMEGGSTDPARTIDLRGADIKLTLKAVTLEDAQGNFSTTHPETMFEPFSVLFSGSLPPSGYASAFVNLIPVSTIRQIAGMAGGQRIDAEVLAEIVVKGELGDDAIQTEPFFYAVNVCNDCVVNNVGACPMIGSPRTGNACNMFQDGVVDCCETTEGLVCPATTM
jgi:hypothetical protein